MIDKNILCNWHLHFDTKEPKHTLSYNTRINEAITKSFYIVDSRFDGLSSTIGGAIYISTSSSSYRIMIDGCLFNKCQATAGHGGGFNVENNCEFVLYKVSGFNCRASSSNFGQLFRSVTSVGSYIHNIYCCSISHCGGDVPNNNYYDVFACGHGLQDIKIMKKFF